MTQWITCEYDDDGEIINPEFVSAPDDSYWWVDSINKLHRILLKPAILGYPERIARVQHPEEADVGLFAAAPDLYKALMAYRGVKKCGHDFTCICAEDMAAAALKKARGEA